jgi:RimJ/RimL family protein N-acetyltransferase
MIETPRLRLRRWLPEDREPFAAMNADPLVMTYLGPPMDRASSDAAIDRMIALADSGAPFFMAAERRADHAFLGFIGVKRITFDAPFAPGFEIGWRLRLEYWRAGYATEGARAALNYGFEKYGLTTIFSFTAIANTRSRAVMERLGMVPAQDGEFDHPDLDLGNPLRRHILYRATRSAR